MKDVRVVITGMGAITPLGLAVEDYWGGLVSGRSGIGPITLFDASSYPVEIAAEVKGFEPTDYMHIKRVNRTARCTQFAIAAARMAVESARLDMSREKPGRVGVLIATTGGVFLLVDEGEKLRKEGPLRIDPC